MNDHTITNVVSVALALMGVAAIALLLSQRSNTSQVFGSFGATLSQALCVALSPVTGTRCGTSVTSTITYGNPTGGPAPIPTPEPTPSVDTTIKYGDVIVKP